MGLKVRTVIMFSRTNFLWFFVTSYNINELRLLQLVFEEFFDF